MSKIYLEILDKERQEVYQALANFKYFGYLAGGTALSLQIQHRKSFDFDVFVSKPISTLLRAKVKDVFGEVNYYTDSTDQISFVTQNNINVTFLWYYFKKLFPVITTNALSLASVQDIAADKAYTIGRRAVWRDYIDLFFLLHDKLLTLEEIIQFAQKKFGGEFNEVLFLQQLSYFKDIEVTNIEFIGSVYEEDQVKQLFENQVETYLAVLNM